jgi:hypothetical protein
MTTNFFTYNSRGNPVMTGFGTIFAERERERERERDLQQIIP